MKEKKKIIISIAAGVAVLAIVITAICVAAGRGKKANYEESTTAEEEMASGELVVIDEISEATGTTEEATAALTQSDEMLTVQPRTTTAEKQTVATQKETTISVATPVTTTETTGAQGGVVIGGSSETEKYSCGVSGHNCDSKETHAFVVGLESKGCEYCGSHSCKSFYSVDEWGNSCYDATRCPKYSTESDPLIYCQECGKGVGDGYNGTCIRYNSDTTCPECGKQVAAKTCHSH